MRTFPILVSLFCLCMSCSAQNAEWLTDLRTIVPLISDKATVGSRFGTPTRKTDPYLEQFDLVSGRLYVHYSRGLCSENPKSLFDVPEFTVIAVFFELGEPVKPKKLKISFDGFEVSHPFDLPKATIYDNRTSGVRYFVNSNGRLESVNLDTPKAADSRRCKSGVSSAKPDGTLTVALESKEARFYIRNASDSAILKIRVMNFSSDSVEISARPMVELIRAGRTRETARNSDWFNGSVDKEYSASQRSNTLAAQGTHDFEIDLNKLEYMGAMGAINLWDSFLSVVPVGEYNVRAVIRQLKSDRRGDEVKFWSSNHVTAVREVEAVGN